MPLEADTEQILLHTLTHFALVVVTCEDKADILPRTVLQHYFKEFTLAHCSLVFITCGDLPETLLKHCLDPVFNKNMIDFVGTSILVPTKILVPTP